jgi:ribose/xylose/arabinose/galactoside ABC-type transport system permease subunit
MTDPTQDDNSTTQLQHEARPQGGGGFDWRRLAAQREIGVLGLLLLTLLAVSIKNPDFLSIPNFRDLLIKAAPTIIISCAVTLVIVTGEIDISVGSLMGLCAAFLGTCTSADRWNQPAWVGILLTLALGGGVGLINGLLVTVGRVPSIIVTLGMLTALRGVTQLVIGQTWIQNMPTSIRFFGTGSISGIPVSVLTAIIVVLAFIVLTRATPLGRRVYAVGSNVRSAKLAGISPSNIKLIVFVITGILTGVATLVSATQLQVVDPSFGKDVELLVVTCVVVGGTSISGGKGSITGTVLGVLLLSSVSTVLIFLQLGTQATYWERAIHGAFILAAVLIDQVSRRRSGSGALS